MTSSTRTLILAAVCGFCILSAHATNLAYPPEPYYDEVHYTNFIRDLMQNQTYTKATSHPPLSHLFVVLTVMLTGDQSLAWRIPSLLAGIIILALIFLLTKRITRDTATAGLAVFFFAFDCLSLTQARIFMPNAIMQMFVLAALYFFLQYYADKPWPRQKAFLGTGLCWGLALSCKLTAFTIGILFFTVIIATSLGSAKERGIIKDSILYLVLVPFVIYFSSHLFIPFLENHSWTDIWEVQVFNMKYHAMQAAKQYHHYSSPWWSWPLMLRPTWYYFESNLGVVNGIIAIGNPAIFWLMPVVVVYLIWDFVRNRSLASGLFLMGFLIQWLFYSWGGRLKFFHYIYNAMPFIAMGLALMIARLWQSGRAGRTLAVFYLILVAGQFVYWYPLLTGLPISEPYYQHHMWFHRWI